MVLIERVVWPFAIYDHGDVQLLHVCELNAPDQGCTIVLVVVPNKLERPISHLAIL